MNLTKLLKLLIDCFVYILITLQMQCLLHFLKQKCFKAQLKCMILIYIDCKEKQGSTFFIQISVVKRHWVFLFMNEISRALDTSVKQSWVVMATILILTKSCLHQVKLSPAMYLVLQSSSSNFFLFYTKWTIYCWPILTLGHPKAHCTHLTSAGLDVLEYFLHNESELRYTIQFSLKIQLDLDLLWGLWLWKMWSLQTGLVHRLTFVTFYAFIHIKR